MSNSLPARGIALNDYLHCFSNVEFILLDPELPRIVVDSKIDFTFSYASLSYTDYSNFWSAINAIDLVSRSFCIQSNYEPNESPDPQLTDYGSNVTIKTIKGYRPSIDTLRNRFPEHHYRIEIHSPEVRGKDVFFYKTEI